MAKSKAACRRRVFFAVFFADFLKARRARPKVTDAFSPDESAAASLLYHFTHDASPIFSVSAVGASAAFGVSDMAASTESAAYLPAR